MGVFGTTVLLGTTLLTLPIATRAGAAADPVDALFTATSAVTVTGLATVDTGSHWSGFGKVVIVLLIQVGGFGIMTVATLFSLLVSGRLGLRARMIAQTESNTLQGSDVRQVIRRVAVFSLVSELILATVLVTRLAVAYDRPIGRALYEGVFHAISAFNHAGLAIWSDSLVRYVNDPWITLSIAVAIIVSSLGFPVVFELGRSWRRPRGWSMLTRITLVVTGALLLIGTLIFTITEWRNPRTLGALPEQTRPLAGFFAAVMPRSAGFNTIDITQMRPESWLATDILMFIGGGSGSPAGGIKLTTFALLGYIVWTEVRGEPSVHVGHRRLPETTQRQVVAIALLGIVLVAVPTYVLLAMTPHSLDQVLFEVVSAFATVGLSTGITADLPAAGHVLLSVLMFMGRIGPLTLGSALALRERPRRYELPEERIIVG